MSTTARTSSENRSWRFTWSSVMVMNHGQQFAKTWPPSMRAIIISSFEKCRTLLGFVWGQNIIGKFYSTKQQIHTCTHLKLIVRGRRWPLPSFTVLTQNYRVPEHQLSSPYKSHPGSHTNTVNCLKMDLIPKFRCNLRGCNITATVFPLLVTKGWPFLCQTCPFWRQAVE